MRGLRTAQRRPRRRSRRISAADFARDEAAGERLLGGAVAGGGVNEGPGAGEGVAERGSLVVAGRKGGGTLGVPRVRALAWRSASRLLELVVPPGPGCAGLPDVAVAVAPGAGA